MYHCFIGITLTSMVPKPMGTSHTNNLCKVFYRLPVPSSLQHLTASFAFWGESFLFTNHTHGIHWFKWTVNHISCSDSIKSFQACPTFSTTPTPSSTCPPTLPLDFSLSSLSVLQCGFSQLSGSWEWRIALKDWGSIPLIKYCQWQFVLHRNLCICLHGSWLMQSAFILYSAQVSRKNTINFTRCVSWKISTSDVGLENE